MSAVSCCACVTVPSATELLALFLYEADLAATAAKELQQPDGSNGNGEALVITDGSAGMSLCDTVVMRKNKVLMNVNFIIYMILAVYIHIDMAERCKNI